MSESLEEGGRWRNQSLLPKLAIVVVVVVVVVLCRAADGVLRAAACTMHRDKCTALTCDLPDSPPRNNSPARWLQWCACECEQLAPCTCSVAAAAPTLRGGGGVVVARSKSTSTLRKEFTELPASQPACVCVCLSVCLCCE